jgi:hypothetical protein
MEATANAIPEIKQFVKLEAPTISNAIATCSGGTCVTDFAGFFDGECDFDVQGALVPNFLARYVAKNSFDR